MIAAGSKFGSWTVVNTDARRAICKCICGNVRALSVEALETGLASELCGCQPLSRDQLRALRAEGAQPPATTRFSRRMAVRR